MSLINKFMENPVANYSLLHHYGICIVSIIIILSFVEIFKKQVYDKYFITKFFIDFKTLIIITFSLLLSCLLPLLELMLFDNFRGISYVASIIICWSISGQSSSILKIVYQILKKFGINLDATK